jgi:WhiB family transcriptional regulator, redox-sensing transcriptional regulator
VSALAPRWRWQDAAACRGRDVVLFYGYEGERGPEKAAREVRAKAVCASCPVAAECLAHATAHREHGIWAGETEDERAARKRRESRARQAGQGREMVA